MLIYIISKILPLLFLPLGIFYILLLLYIFFKKKLIIIFAPLFLWISSTHFVSQTLLRLVEKPWEQKTYESIEKGNAIVVLSGGLHPNSKKRIIAEWSDPDRFFSGIKLFKNGRAPFLIFTSGIRPLQPNIIPESEIYFVEAMNYGIPRESILISKNAKNTYEEAIAINQILKPFLNSDKRKVILVTSAFHMTRAKKIFEKQNFEVIPFPVDFRTYDFSGNKTLYLLFGFIPNANNLVDSSLAIREIMGRIIYRSF